MTLLADSLSWLGQAREHAGLVWWGLAVSLVLMLGGIWLARWLVVAMPADYFVRSSSPAWLSGHPALRWTVLVAKNMLGVLLAVAGLFMLVAPGPGIVTILAAVILLDFPGKRALEGWFLALPAVLSTINKMRQRANQPPLEMPKQ